MLPSKSSLKLKQKCIFEFPSRLRADYERSYMLVWMDDIHLRLDFLVRHSISNPKLTLYDILLDLIADRQLR